MDLQTMTQPQKNIPQLRFSEFNGEWEEKQIGDLCATFKSGMGITSEQIKDNDEYPVYGGNGLRGYTKTYTHDGFFLLIGRQGALCGNINRSFGKAYISEHAIAVQANNEADTEWLAQRLDLYNLNRLSESSAQPGLAVNKVVKFKLFAPSQKEQQKIAEFLSAVDDLLAKLQEKKSLLLEYKKGVMQQIFEQKIRFTDDHGNQYPDWEEKKLGDFLIPTFREIDKPESNYLAIGIRSHCKGTFQKPDSEPEKIAMEKLYVVRENDFIVNITFAWEGALAIAKKEDDGGLVSHRFPTYTFDKNVTTHDFFRYIYTNKKFISIMELISPGGAGRNRVLNKNNLLKVKIFIPQSITEQQKIADFLTAIDAKIEAVAQQIGQAQAYKKALLQQMFV